MRYKSFGLQEISTKKTINFCSSSFTYRTLFFTPIPVSNVQTLIVLAPGSYSPGSWFLAFGSWHLVLCSLLFALYSLLYILHRKIAFQFFQRIFTGLYIPDNLSFFEHYGAFANFGHVVEVVAGDEHGHVVFFLQVIEQSFQADL